MLYFAYGSNLHPRRLQLRLDAVRCEGGAVLDGRRLVFHKRGLRDGSGKCDVVEATSPKVVHGALFRLSPVQWQKLQHIEGVGAGYQVSEIEVETGADRVAVQTLTAQPTHVDAALAPFDWYKAMVIAGAMYHRFPTSYVAAIERVASVRDPDSQRAADCWSLVAELESKW